VDSSLFGSFTTIMINLFGFLKNFLQDKNSKIYFQTFGLIPEKTWAQPGNPRDESGKFFKKISGLNPGAERVTPRIQGVEPAG
jgi:hypothetical protein